MLTHNLMHRKQRVSPVVLTPPAQVDMYGHANGPWAFSSFKTTTRPGNFTNAHFIFTASGGLPAFDGVTEYKWSLQRIGGYALTASILRPSASTGSELTVPANLPLNGNMDIFISGNSGGAISNYRVTVTDGLTSASIDFNTWGYW